MYLDDTNSKSELQRKRDIYAGIDRVRATRKSVREIADARGRRCHYKKSSKSPGDAGIFLSYLEDPRGRITVGWFIARAPIHRKRSRSYGSTTESSILHFACRFQGDVFRRWYRMRPHVFDQMMHDVANHDPYFLQTDDASGRVGLSIEQKLTCTMRMLAYGLPADLCDEFLDVAKSTALEILSHFTRAIWNVYHDHYLRRPTPADLQRLLNVADKRGFPGMVGSFDCMHWKWKNCPTSWQGHFTGYKGKPTIILEAVASYDAWIWHAYFGLPGSLNDINVLGMSPLFNEICTANRNPITPEQAHFTKMQESYRKDVERAFGILQARFAIVGGPARGWDREDLQYIMMTCIIFHNMIVDDEREEDEDSSIDLDDIPTRLRKTQIYERYEDDHEIERTRPELEEFMTRYQGVRCPIVHRVLQGDLVNHLWNMKLQAKRNRR
ncbi:uncharacterized protein LOC112171583 [Rosa chinensis]|uniref:uncharacterized protein LOC112171583 n=1 Tax=Rosa chinensis TaxID=74649 RepID=UPI000D08994C|nr:uncharacterized protein LOC112171583 [Rosa chinensis]